MSDADKSPGAPAQWCSNVMRHHNIISWFSWIRTAGGTHAPSQWWLQWCPEHVYRACVLSMCTARVDQLHHPLLAVPLIWSSGRYFLWPKGRWTEARKSWVMWLQCMIWQSCIAAQYLCNECGMLWLHKAGVGESRPWSTWWARGHFPPSSCWDSCKNAELGTYMKLLLWRGPTGIHGRAFR